MIPPCDPGTGNLPPGIHDATWAELMARYGYTSQRRALLAGLHTASGLLHAAGCQRVYIDGSFVSAAETPGDFEACWEVAGVDVPRLVASAPMLVDLRPPRATQKALFGGELFPAQVSADPFGTAFLDYFQRDRVTGEPKGIVAINLRDWP